jgi:hypothetical protein
MARYRLSSIIFHTGMQAAGHYVTLVRDPTERWTHLNYELDLNLETLDDVWERDNLAMSHGCFTPYIFGCVKAEAETGISWNPGGSPVWNRESPRPSGGNRILPHGF